MKFDYESLKEFLHYDPDSGLFTWKKNKGTARAGDSAGTQKSDGYVYVGFCGKDRAAHRLAWFYVHGYWSENQIDHINRKKTDNRICNLREVSHTCNVRNVGARKDNTTGVIGVCWYPTTSKWTAQIQHKGKRLRLGYFKSKIDAAKARYEAETKYGWNSCNTISSALEYILKHEPNYDTTSPPNAIC